MTDSNPVGRPDADALFLARRRVLGGLSAMAAASLAAPLGVLHSGYAQAQVKWPSKPIYCIVPYGPGVVALVSRVVTEQMALQLGQAIVMENKAGASGNVGADYVLRAPRDGYTFMACAPFLTTNPILMPTAKWKTSDFVGIGVIGAPPNVFVVPASVPVNSMRELVEYVKARPGALNVGNPSIGSSNHLGQELLFNITGMDMVNIMYKTQPDMLNELFSGQLTLSLMTIAVALPHIRTGKLKALAISAPRRVPELPDLPTIGEAGYAEAMFLPWFGFVAAADTPRPIIRRLSDEMQKALAHPDVVSRLEKLGTQLTPMPAEEFDKLIASETQRWATVIRQRNIKADL